jgi:uncharacterized membrane protein
MRAIGIYEYHDRRCSIGGAGTFNGFILSDILAAYLA